MADLSDVRDALVSLCAQILYPDGNAQPSVTGQNIRIYAGWPVSNELDQDLKAGVVNVTVYPTMIERNTTRYPKAWQAIPGQAATLTASVSGQQIALGGTISTPQNVAALVNGKPYVYAVQANETLTGIATALAALINVDTPASSSGAVISIPGGIQIIARVGFSGKAVKEVRRQERVIKIMVWANSDPARDQVIRVIDPILADTERLTMPDSTSARLIYPSGPVDDNPQKEALYRRDLQYKVEYATTLTQSFTSITQAEVKVTEATTGNTLFDQYE